MKKQVLMIKTGKISAHPWLGPMYMFKEGENSEPMPEEHANDFIERGWAQEVGTEMVDDVDEADDIEGQEGNESDMEEFELYLKKMVDDSENKEDANEKLEEAGKKIGIDIDKRMASKKVIKILVKHFISIN